MKGKYVTATKEAKPFVGATLEQVAQGKHRKGFFGGNCMECRERGHKAVECPKHEYVKEGKTVVPPLRLYKNGLLNAVCNEAFLH